MASVYLAAVLLLGGAGNYYPLITALLEAGALLLIAWVAVAAQPMPLRISRFGMLVALAILSIPLLQLVPLPFSIWSQLPGREEAAANLALAGVAQGWRPASLEPAATLASALAMLPAFAMFFAASVLGPAERRRLIQIVIGVALISVLIGALQRGSNGAAITTLFPSTHSAFSPGLFVNRNHQAAFVLLAMILTAALFVKRPGDGGARFRRGQELALPIAIGLIGLFAAGALATTSRMGLLVLPVALAVSLLFVFRFRLAPLSVAAALGAIAILSLAASQIQAVRTIVGRFTLSEIRLDYWTDSWTAVQQYWPVGSGLGTFRTVFPAFEQLDFVVAGRPNNAHNDYLELLLEGGAAALVVFLLFGAWLIALGLALWRKGGPDRRLGFAALAGIGILMLHSLTDYPMRMLSLMALFGLLLGLAMAAAARPLSSRAERDGEGVPAPRAGRWLVLPTAAPILFAILAVGVADRAVAVGRPDLAAHILPGSSRAEAAAAGAALAQRRFDAAAADAAAAVRSSPLEPWGLVMLALAEDARGRPDSSFLLMSRASSFGWRNRVAQAWTFERAIEQGAVDVAVLRADALLRQRELEERVFPALRQLAARPGAAEAIARRLATMPQWRTSYLRHLRALTPAGFAAHEAVLRHLARTTAPADAAERNAFLDELVDQRRFAQAMTLWNALGNRGRGAARPDGGDFERSNLFASQSPFEWRPGQIPGVFLYLEASPPPSLGTSLRVQTEGAAAGSLLSRVTRLTPGDWILEARARQGAPASLEAIDWSVTCLDGGVAEMRAARAGPSAADGPWAALRDVVAIPASGCAAQRVELRVSHQGSRGIDTWIDDLAIRRAGDARTGI